MFHALLVHFPYVWLPEMYVCVLDNLSSCLLKRLTETHMKLCEFFTFSIFFLRIHNMTFFIVCYCVSRTSFNIFNMNKKVFWGNEFQLTWGSFSRRKSFLEKTLKASENASEWFLNDLWGFSKKFYWSCQRPLEIKTLWLMSKYLEGVTRYIDGVFRLTWRWKVNKSLKWF